MFGNASVHLEFSVQMAVHMMVMSDVLITSQSSLSYAAAVHSSGCNGNVHAIEFCTHVTGSAVHIPDSFVWNAAMCSQFKGFSLLSMINLLSFYHGSSETSFLGFAVVSGMRHFWLKQGGRSCVAKHIDVLCA